MHTPNRLKGWIAELVACAYLSLMGLELVTRNYRCRTGEIDIVMTDARTLVFVEVRYRKSALFGGAIGSITRTKQVRLVRAARSFLRHRPKFAAYTTRFDVIAIQHRKISWLKNAFEC